MAEDLLLVGEQETVVSNEDDIMVASNENIMDLIESELNNLKSMGATCLFPCFVNLDNIFLYDELENRGYNSHVLFKPTAFIRPMPLIINELKQEKYSKVLYLGIAADSPLKSILKKNGIEVHVQTQDEDNAMIKIDTDITAGRATLDKMRAYVGQLIDKYKTAHKIDAVIIGCADFLPVLDSETFSVPVVNPLQLQVTAALEYVYESY